jgi:hypothetical protein
MADFGSRPNLPGRLSIMDGAHRPQSTLSLSLPRLTRQGFLGDVLNHCRSS